MATNKNLQKFNTWNTLVPIYKDFLEHAKEHGTGNFFISYYENKVAEAIRLRDEAYNKLSKTIQKTLEKC